MGDMSLLHSTGTALQHRRKQKGGNVLDDCWRCVLCQYHNGGVEWETGVNGRMEDVLNRPTFIHNLINPALEVQKCLTSFM